MVAAKDYGFGRCKGCDKQLKRPTTTGYCSPCFHTVPGVKTNYERARWDSGASRAAKWRSKGIVFDENDVAAYDKATHCGLCGKRFHGDKALDHDHKTGHVRGALCRSCNTALGKLGDDLAAVIERVCDYWSRYMARIARTAGGTH